MTTRRRWIAGLVLGFLCLALLVVVALNFRSERPDVQLLFLGYTNVLMGGRGSVPGSRADTFSVRMAVLLVTNCGSVPVQVLPVWHADAYGSNVLTHVYSYPLKLPRVLKPHESARAELFSTGKEEPVRAELAYHRQGFSDRLSERAHASTNTVVRAAGKFLLPPPKPHWARSEPITNSVESVRRYHITGPPPPVTHDMLFAPRNE